MSYRILIVDDEPDICHILKFNLEEYGFNVDMASSAEEALKLDLSEYAVFLLDIMMEGISGHDLLKILRNDYKLKTPVVFITAMGSDDDLEQGYMLGADDYIRKPFSVREVVLRVRALLQRSENNIDKPAISKFPKIDNNRKRVIFGNTPVEFTPTEYDIFKFLCQQPGKVYSREEILNHIWPNQQNILGRTVDVNITRIRKKMGKHGNCIRTRSGYGYFFDYTKVVIA
jgi:two-component system, OmpR family, alkaline phosphatase synthesis response regulator PhoP